MNGSDTPEPVLSDARSASTPSAGHLLLAVGVIVVAGIAAYWNSFAGVLVFEDIEAIQANESIRSLGTALFPPAASPTAGRPLVNLTLAVNYALGGTEDLWSYHAVNLAIHILAALALMGVVRRTVLTAPLVERLGRAALPLGVGTALLWMLHPVQTEAVTYVSQRSESLVGLAYLLTVYCAIRGASSDKPKGWYVAAALACAAGMASKAVMVTAPLAVLIYDRLFMAGGWRKALARRWPLYVGLAATWVILAALAGSRPRPDDLPSATLYAKTQAGVILQYLILTVWPVRQSVDYAWPWATRTVEFLPQAVVVIILLAATVWTLLRGRIVAMAGAWFFLVLAATSSLVPTADPIFEHRLYLPLAGLAALVVVGGYGLTTSPRGKEQVGRVPASVPVLAAVVVVAAAVILGWLTHQRNKVYASRLAFWEAAAEVQRLNEHPSHRTETHLGNALIEAGRVKEGTDHLLLAMRVDSTRWQTPYRLASVLMESGRHAEAVGSLRQLTRLRPDWAEPYRMLGDCYDRLGQPNLAVQFYRQALDREPDRTDIRAALERAKGRLPSQPAAP